MKLTSLGGLMIVGNLVFGFWNVINPASPFLSTFGGLAVFVGGVLAGMMILEPLVRRD